ncbi:MULTISPECIES: LytTR family transcriptional regulator DNA-binding domain-containing protein [Arenibacter]|uniref:LytTR family transcriptional regulator DNA-binding domain-containing protein n=1 Tax=Arenibacter TaxID=178469 RepID=UPI001300047A|nr:MULTISPECIES: LytTR family transcriptional regulator DNA-binding domain-containing protein [Arenibacter]
MKKDNLHLFTLLAISLIVFIIGYFAMAYMLRESASQILAVQIESSKREAKELAGLISSQLDNGIERQTVINNFQRIIEGTNLETGFVCMLDWSGVEICHPDPQKIGKKNNPDVSYTRALDSEINPGEFYDLISNKKQNNQKWDTSIGNFNSEIIYLFPVKNSDWILAAHANLDKIEEQLEGLRLNFLLIYLLSSSVMSLLALLMVRFLGSYYEKALELKNEKLAEEVLSLSKLNSDLYHLKNQLNKTDVKDDKNIDGEDNGKIKNRLLTYSKDKLISVRVDEIAFINTENSLTTITCLDGQKHSSNSSLDELMGSLDPLYFFRANRQFIISVKGIYEIFRYGNNQLKIKLNPASSKTIVISKNKVSEFKKWLNY